jgi:hypothetical protein
MTVRQVMGPSSGEIGRAEYIRSGGILPGEGDYIHQQGPTQDVFQHSRLITRRHRYEDVVAAPPKS